MYHMDLPGGSAVKNPPAKQETGSIPGSGRCPGEGNGNPLQYSCLENLMNRGVSKATVHGVTRVELSNITTTTTVYQRGWGVGEPDYYLSLTSTCSTYRH